MKADILIIGGGPAGLSAALKPALNGLKVIIIDETSSMGGQLKQQTQFYRNLPLGLNDQRGYMIIQTLIEKLLSLEVEMLTKHTMVGVYKDGAVGVSNGEKVFPVYTKKTIVATGIAEEAKIFPGWTMPGVMTIGAAQILMNREFVQPGKNAIICGSNNYSLETAKQLHEIGVNVHGIIESESKIQGDDFENINYLKGENIKFYCSSSIIRAYGKGQVEKVVLDANGNEESIDVDLICIGVGVSPVLETLEVINCDMTHRGHLGGWVPRYDECFETSITSTYVAGNAAGITNLQATLLIGEIVGTSVSVALGKISEEDSRQIVSGLWKELYKMESIKGKDVFEERLSLISEFSFDYNRKSLMLMEAKLEESFNG